MRDNATPNLCPSYTEMAHRMRSKARSLRCSAARYGEDTPKGRHALDDAASFERIAEAMIEKAIEQLHARDGMLAEYRKVQANRA